MPFYAKPVHREVGGIMGGLFGKFSLPKIFQKKKSRGPTLKGLDGFSDPMLDAQWIKRNFNLSTIEDAARHQGCYFAAWMHVDTPQYLTSEQRDAFMGGSDQLSPSSTQGAGVMQFSDMCMSVKVDGEAAEQLRKYYRLLTVVRSASNSGSRSKVKSVWSSMVAACGGDTGMAESAAMLLNQTGVPTVIETYVRYLQGIGNDRQPAGSILIPTGSGFELKTVVM
jgi:hypothetical protein